MERADLAAIVDAVSDPERRLVTRFVADGDGTVTTLEELTTHVVTEHRAEGEESISDVEYTQRVAIHLHHVHLPTLDGASVLEYDPEERVVRVGPTIDRAIEVIDAVESDDGKRRIANLV